MNREPIRPQYTPPTSPPRLQNCCKNNELWLRERFVHNHPSGDPSPSSADIDMTRQIVEALKPLRISVHDHLVVGRDGVASFKALGLI